MTLYLCCIAGNIRVKNKSFESMDTLDTSRDTLLEYIREHDRSEQFMYNFDSILIATNNFSSSNKLGEGGFGPVYKVSCYHLFHGPRQCSII